MKSVAASWNRFWFEPQPTSTLALVRMAFGLVVLLWALSLRVGFFGLAIVVVPAPVASRALVAARVHCGRLRGRLRRRDGSARATAEAAPLDR